MLMFDRSVEKGPNDYDRKPATFDQDSSDVSLQLRMARVRESLLRLQFVILIVVSGLFGEEA